MESKPLGKEGIMMCDLIYKIRSLAATHTSLIIQITNLGGRWYHSLSFAAR